MIFFTFSLSGFGTAVSFASLKNEDIESAYDFVRTKLAERLNESDIKVHFYGHFYSSSPNDFSFQPGDLRLIENLVAHVQRKTEGNKDGFKYFKKKEKHTKLQRLD